MRTLRKKLVRDLRRQRTQSVAIALTIFAGTLLAVISAGAYRDLEASYARVFEVTGFADLWVAGGDVDGFAAAAAREPGVVAEPRAVADLPLEVSGRRFLGRVVALAPDATVNRVILRAGAPLAPGDTGGILVEEHLARHDGLAPGDTLSILGPDGWREVTIRGVAASAEYLWPARDRQDVLPAPGSFGVAFADPALLGELGAAATETAVRWTDDAPAATEARLRALAAAHGATAVIARAEQPSNATLRADIDGFRSMAVMFPFLFLTAAGLATAVLLARRVRTERAVIGTLRACGFSRARIVRHYLGHGVVLGAAGAVPGAIAGVLAARAATTAYTAAIDVPITVTSAHPAIAAIAIAAGVLAGILAAAGPARAAARIAPAHAMRGIVPEAGGATRPWLERAIPPLRRLPARWRLVARNLGRNPRRTLSTMLGVVLAATLILVSWGMLDSTRAMLHRQFQVIERRDAMLYLVPGASPGAVTAAAAEGAGVAANEPVDETPVTIRAAGGDHATALLAFPAATTMHRFLDGDREHELGDGVLFGRALADQLGLRAGDAVELVLPGARLEARVDGFVDEPLGTYAYVSLATLEAAGAGAPPGLAVRIAPGADRAAALAALGELPGVAVVHDTRALAAAADEYMALFHVFVGTMLVLGGALAFTILFVTMSVNLAERTTELATLRAGGVSLRAIGRLVTVENLLITALGLVPGLAIGILAADAFLASLSTDMFRIDLALRWTTPALTALALLAVALASQLPGLRALRRLDLGRVVRERSA